MKTATVRELRNRFASISAWLEQGETVLLTRRGKPLGRIVPEPKAAARGGNKRRKLFAERFAPLHTLPKRDLQEVVAENRNRR
jgi:antitoxin (DNA-binding transcriptional repressor) of toxin-antitoxin stability system